MQKLHTPLNHTSTREDDAGFMACYNGYLDSNAATQNNYLVYAPARTQLNYHDFACLCSSFVTAGIVSSKKSIIDNDIALGFVGRGGCLSPRGAMGEAAVCASPTLTAYGCESCVSIVYGAMGDEQKSVAFYSNIHTATAPAETCKNDIDNTVTAHGDKFMSDSMTQGASMYSEIVIDATTAILASLHTTNGCSAVADCAFDASFTFLGKENYRACYGPIAMTNDTDKAACTDFTNAIISLGLSSVTINSEAQAVLEGWVSEHKLIERVA